MLRAFCSEWTGDSTIPGIGREELHHLVRVRRVRAGEQIEILNGRGALLRCNVTAVTGNSLELEIKDHQVLDPPPLRTHLLVAIPKGKTFPALLHKAVELGVSIITPLLTEHTEVDAARIEAKSGRWQSVLIEAVKQSGNPWMPDLGMPCTLGEALVGNAGRDDLMLCAALQPDAQPLLDVLDRSCPSSGRVAAFVGPEGDFSPGEYELLRTSGCRFVSLGAVVLKVETAASLMVGGISLFCQKT